MWILNIYTFASISKNWQPTYTEALMINFKKWVLILHFKKNIVKIKNRLSILNVFVFFINVKVNQGIPPFLGNSHFSSTLLFLEKIFHCHFYCQIRGSQTPFIKGWSGVEGSNYGRFSKKGVEKK